jgi:hypothetical protein
LLKCCVASNAADSGTGGVDAIASEPSTYVVPVEVSINEPIGADQSFVLGDDRRSLRVSAPEDIVACPASC